MAEIIDTPSDASAKIFVGHVQLLGLAWATDANSLRNTFQAFGDIEDATVIKDRETGRSRGFGFVTFSNAESAQSAIDNMNDQDIDGRRVNVKLATQRSSGGGGGYSGGGGYQGGRGRGRGGAYGQGTPRYQ